MATESFDWGPAATVVCSRQVGGVVQVCVESVGEPVLWTILGILLIRDRSCPVLSSLVSPTRLLVEQAALFRRKHASALVFLLLRLAEECGTWPGHQPF